MTISRKELIKKLSDLRGQGKTTISLKSSTDTLRKEYQSIIKKDPSSVLPISLPIPTEGQWKDSLEKQIKKYIKEHIQWVKKSVKRGEIYFYSEEDFNNECNESYHLSKVRLIKETINVERNSFFVSRELNQAIKYKGMSRKERIEDLSRAIKCYITSLEKIEKLEIKSTAKAYLISSRK